MPAPVDSYAAFVQSVHQHADRPALIIEDQTWTYRDFGGIVGGIAQLFQGLDVGTPARVGIYTATDAPTYASLLAAHAVGAAYVPVNHKFPLERQSAVVADAGLTVLLASTPVPEGLQAAHPEVQIIDTSGANPAPLPSPLPFDADRLAYLLFTSGSTGRPKGVPLTHGNLRTFLATMTSLTPLTQGERVEDALTPTLSRGEREEYPYDFQPIDRFVQMFELTFDLSVFSFFVPMCIGAACCPVPAGAPGGFGILDTLETQQVTVALLVPSTLAYLKPYLPEIELPHLRWSLFCGEALPAAVTEQWAARIPQARIENVYGPTEATIFCTRYRWDSRTSPAESVRGVVPIGQPLRDVEVLLWANDAPASVEGELLLGGAQVTPGYWQNPAKNAEAFVHHNGLRWYRTGDFCRWDANGNLIYLGRTDSQVKVDGYRVELGEIEHHARQLSHCAQLAVVAVPTPAGTTELHLWLEAFAGDVEMLRTQLQGVLPAYMVPRVIRTLPSLPLNSNGKIDRVALRGM